MNFQVKYSNISNSSVNSVPSVFSAVQTNCIQGQNKNQDSINIDIDSLLESQIKEHRVQAQQGNALNETHKLLLGANNSTIKLYPNPAENYLLKLKMEN